MGAVRRVTFTSHPQHKSSLAAPPFTPQRIYQQ
ncbi:hypothetical protein VD0002_g6686 [Verticillium dahliae]|uniref:Uncharacterized protein n=1 Tax=Verticillium dahliae TaxID=27337 RepID=A0AA44WHQ0_VERDA|nr:hypothetical protein BJF96_g4876 [Verticillium dahliae]PNH61031.1 hypothetical protein VD0002_g6686 [Verticillium dahliae]